MLEDRPQPHNLEIERHILAACFRGELSRVNDNRVDADTFYSHVHREVFKAMLEVKKSGMEPDIVSVCDRMQLNDTLEQVGGEVFVAELFNSIATAARLDNWIKIHMEYHARRLMINRCTDILTQCYISEKDSQELFLEHRERLAEIEAFACGMVQKPTIEKLKDFNRYLVELQAGIGGHVIPFGIEGLDDFIQLQLKQMFVLGGLSNTGKTRFILCDAIGKARKNVASAIFSFENPANIIVSGMVSIISGVSMSKMTRKEALNNNDMEKISQAMKFLKDNNHLIYIFGKGDYEHSVAGISAETRRIQDNTGGRLKIAYVDYLQNMKASKKLPRVEQIESCVSGLSEVAAEFNIAVMPLTQLNRDKDRDKSGRRPILADMKGSGEIENAADYVVFLHRANKSETGNVELDIYTEKVRGTSAFDEKLLFNTHNGRIDGIAPKPNRFSSMDYPQSHNRGAKDD